MPAIAGSTLITGQGTVTATVSAGTPEVEWVIVPVRKANPVIQKRTGKMLAEANLGSLVIETSPTRLYVEDEI